MIKDIVNCERFIPLDTESVRAILDDRKFQFRLPINPQPLLPRREALPRMYDGRVENCLLACKIKPGDRLSIREGWQWYGRYRDDRPEGGFQYRADLTSRTFGQLPEPIERWKEFDLAAITGTWNRWRPPAHMPAWAARIFIEIASVRVERIQAITTDDVRAEGVRIPCTENYEPLIRLTGKHPPIDYLRSIDVPAGERYADDELMRAHFASAWDCRNAKLAAWDRLRENKIPGVFAWEKNPWVFVVAFEKMPELDLHHFPKDDG